MITHFGFFGNKLIFKGAFSSKEGEFRSPIGLIRSELSENHNP